MPQGKESRKLIKAQRDELEHRLQMIMAWNQSCLKPQSVFMGAELDALVQGTAKTVRLGFTFDE